MFRMCTQQCSVGTKGTVRELYLCNILVVLLSQVLDRRAIHDQGDLTGVCKCATKEFVCIVLVMKSTSRRH